MSLVEYGFYSDEEGDAASLPSDRNPPQPAELSPQNAENSLSDSEATCNSRASTPAPSAASSRAVDTAKADSSPGGRKGGGDGPQGGRQNPTASPIATTDEAGEGETEAAESEEQRRALDEERAAVRLCRHTHA